MRKVLTLMISLLLLIPLSVTSASSATYQTVSSSGTISYLTSPSPTPTPSSWIPFNAILIAKTDFSDITLSSQYKQGVLEWYPDVQTWIGRAREEDLTIVQHPLDAAKKALKITFDGKKDDESPIRPMFHIFLDESNTMTDGIENELWVEAKYYFPEDFAITTSNPWFIWCEPFVEYEENPELPYPSHNFDANFLVYRHPTENFNYLQLSITSRGYVNGVVTAEDVFADRWNQQRPLPQGEEFTVRWHVKRHLTNGVFELWLNGEKIVDFVGQTTEKGEAGRVDLGWRTIPHDHYCDPGNPVTSNYLTYLEVWGR